MSSTSMNALQTMQAEISAEMDRVVERQQRARASLQANLRSIQHSIAQRVPAASSSTIEPRLRWGPPRRAVPAVHAEEVQLSPRSQPRAVSSLQTATSMLAARGVSGVLTPRQHATGVVSVTVEDAAADDTASGSGSEAPRIALYTASFPCAWAWLALVVP
jgi:hypothetical protein